MKKIISLDGKWRLEWRDKKGISHSMFVQVPGDVHVDLFKKVKIPDPYFGKNAEECRWMEDVEWWYNKKFFIDTKIKHSMMELVFYGIDTCATIWLNGYRLGKHSNMFRPAIFRIGDKIISRENILVVKISSPHIQIKSDITREKNYRRLLDREKIQVKQFQERFLLRKAQVTYGWDMAPRLLSVGIWKNVELRIYDKINIDNVFIKTEAIDEKAARIDATLLIENFCKRDLRIKIILQILERRDIKKELTLKLKHGKNLIKAQFHVVNPRLWWPWNMGKPVLYTCVIEISKSGIVLDRYSTKFGIRVIKLLLEKDKNSNEKSMVFLINGKKIFVKGANWIPPDCFFGNIPHGKNRKLLKLAKEGNINMIRIWGGGIVDKNAYEICDKFGIMVWQDFMFACGLYPDNDKKFIKEVKLECAYLVKYLYNHPSIVLWCGGNELEAFTYINISGNKIPMKYLWKLVNKIDPTRPYRPSSPWNSDSKEEIKNLVKNCQHLKYIDNNLCIKCIKRYRCNYFKNQIGEDTHNWIAWTKGKTYRYYSRDRSGFVSEFGQDAFPDMGSIKKFIPSNKIWPLNDYYKYHNANFTYQDNSLKPFGTPRDIHSYIKLTQISQAVSYKYAIEHFRRRKFKCGGCLYWKLNDIWPGISGSVIDYYLKPKIAYYYSKRAYSNLLVSFEDNRDFICIWIISDYFRPMKVTLTIRHLDFDGNLFWKQTESVNCIPNSSFKIVEIRKKDLRIKDRYREYLHCSLKMKEEILSENFQFFCENKDLKFPIAKLSLKVKGNTLKISADKYARLVKLNVMGGDRYYFSDNYFDIPAKEERIINIKSPKNNSIVAKSLRCNGVYG